MQRDAETMRDPPVALLNRYRRSDASTLVILNVCTCPGGKWWGQRDGNAS